MAVTKLEKLINPEVMASMIAYELEQKLRLTGFYKVDRTLTGRPGDTVTVPAWKYIGAAEHVAENEQVPSREMDTEYMQYTVLKAAVEVTLTDEAVLSGFSDPVGETTRQLRLAIQERMEMDGLEQIRSITPTNGLVHTAAALDYEAIVEAIDLLKLEDQGTSLFLLANSANVKKIRLDPRFTDRMTAGGDRIVFIGVIGTIAGAQVVISNRLNDDEAYILTNEALTAFMKRDINIETQREMSFKRTKIGSDCHYLIAIEDFDKLVRIDLA